MSSSTWVAQSAVIHLPIEMLQGESICRSIAAGEARNLGYTWNAKDISKVLVYRSLVQSILVYNAETWTLDATSDH